MTESATVVFTAAGDYLYHSLHASPVLTGLLLHAQCYAVHWRCSHENQDLRGSMFWGEKLAKLQVEIQSVVSVGCIGRQERASGQQDGQAHLMYLEWL